MSFKDAVKNVKSKKKGKKGGKPMPFKKGGKGDGKEGKGC